MIKIIGEDDNNLKEENKKEEENEESGNREQETEQGGNNEKDKEGNNQTIGEDDKWPLLTYKKSLAHKGEKRPDTWVPMTLPRTGNDYFIVKLIFVDFIIFIGFISRIYHKKYTKEADC